MMATGVRSVVLFLHDKSRNQKQHQNGCVGSYCFVFLFVVVVFLFNFVFTEYIYDLTGLEGTNLASCLYLEYLLSLTHACVSVCGQFVRFSQGNSNCQTNEWSSEMTQLL